LRASSKKEKMERIVWTDDKVFLLLQLRIEKYGDLFQAMSSKSQLTTGWNRIQQEFNKEANHFHSIIQLKNKYNLLKSTFRNIKDKEANQNNTLITYPTFWKTLVSFFGGKLLQPQQQHQEEQQPQQEQLQRKSLCQPTPLQQQQQRQQQQQQRELLRQPTPSSQLEPHVIPVTPPQSPPQPQQQCPRNSIREAHTTHSIVTASDENRRKSLVAFSQAFLQVGESLTKAISVSSEQGNEEILKELKEIKKNQHEMTKVLSNLNDSIIKMNTVNSTILETFISGNRNINSFINNRA
jgi:hypothetical protein